MAAIYSIVYTPKGSTRQSPDAYVRVPLEKASLVVGHGIDGDRKGGNPNRQLNIMSYETLAALEKEGFTVKPGAMGEQIILEGLDVNQLQQGDRIRLGERALVEVVSHRNGCDRFQHIQGHHPSEAKGRLGIMAKVIQGGTIAPGDVVTQVESATVIEN